MNSLRILIISLVSVILSYLFSPSTNVADLLSKDWSASIQVLVMSGCLFLSAAVNGYSDKMFINSKADYGVNLLIVSIVGVGGGAIVFYFTSFKYIGRWVIIFSVIINWALSWMLVAFLNRSKMKAVLLIGSNSARFIQMLVDVNAVDVNKNYKKIDLDLNSSDIGDKITNLSRFGEVCILPISSESSSFNDSVFQNSNRFCSCIYSVNILADREIGVIDLAEVRYLSWWEVPTMLRDSVFSSIKRMLDIVFVLIAAVPAIILIIISFFLIKAVDGGSVFYKQIRLGQYRKPFYIFKLRTMRENSEGSEARWAACGDRRITPIGRIFRKTRIDELPQLWNILRGDMSWVGPRPERPEFYKIIENEVPQFGLRLACRPGLSGWAQVNYPYGASIHDSKVKLMYDLYYINKASFTFDLRVISRTFIAMFKGAR